MRIKLSSMSTLLVVATVLVLTVAGSASLAAEQVVKITSPANSFAHTYRPFPVTSGNEFSALLSVKATADAGSSWAPSLFLYWSATSFVGIGQQPDNAMRVNAQGLGAFKATQPGIRANDWTDLKLNVTASLIQGYAKPRGGEWALVFEVARPEGCAGMPAEIILGKGFGNNTATYPAEHLDNSTAKAAKVGVSYIDNLVVVVDGKEMLVDAFNTLDAWKMHLDAAAAPTIEVVTE